VNSKEQALARVYPNPANNFLTVEVNNRSNVELINSLGQIVATKTVESKENLDVSHLNDGVYFAKITNENGMVKTEKVIIK
jgi:hypothetical protein